MRRSVRMTEARYPTTLLIPNFSSGGGVPVLATPSTNTNSCTDRWMRTRPTRCTATRSASAPRLRCPRKCGPPTGSRSTSSGSGRWTSCGSIRRYVSTSTAWPAWRFCHGRCGLFGGPLNLFATTGFLPPEFRAHMQLPWSQAQQRRFELLLTALRLVDQVIPRQLWLFGYELYLRDMRARAKRGRRIV